MVARYNSFTLVEATGDDVDSLQGAGAGRRDDMREVLLAGGQVDPAQRPSLAAKDAPERREALVLVQYVGPVKETWLARLRATGASVLGYAAQNGYIVHAAGDALDRVTELVGSDPTVRAATALRSSRQGRARRGRRSRGGADGGRRARQGRPPRGRERGTRAGLGAVGRARADAVPRPRAKPRSPTSRPTPPWWRSSPPACPSCTTSGAHRSLPATSPATRRAVRATPRGLRRRDSEPPSASPST